MPSSKGAARNSTAPGTTERREKALDMDLNPTPEQTLFREEARDAFVEGRAAKFDRSRDD